jgi:hypothetical protein
VNYVYRHGKKIAIDSICTPIKERKRFEAQFVKLPVKWIERLEQSKSPGTFKLAHRILTEAFKRQYLGGEIVLSTETTGLPRKVRSRAVKELVGLGLIQVEQSGNQAVRVMDLLLLH